MNRRELFRGLAGVAGGLLLPPSVAEVSAEVERRWWALGAMPSDRVSDAWFDGENWFPAHLRPKYDQVTYYVGQSYYPGAGPAGLPAPPKGMSVEDWNLYHAFARVTDVSAVGETPVFTRWTLLGDLKDV